MEQGMTWLNRFPITLSHPRYLLKCMLVISWGFHDTTRSWWNKQMRIQSSSALHDLSPFVSRIPPGWPHRLSSSESFTMRSSTSIPLLISYVSKSVFNVFSHWIWTFELLILKEVVPGTNPLYFFLLLPCTNLSKRQRRSTWKDN